MAKLTKFEESLPTRKLPIGMTEFNALVEELINHPDSPTKDADSVTFALASIIMHLEQGEDELPIEFFLRYLRAGAAKQIAGAAFHEVKMKHQKAAEDAKAAEVAKVVENEQVS